MYSHLIIWGSVFAVMVVAELATMQLVSIWFAAGALGAFIAAIFDLSFAVQLVIFTLISLVLLVATRPILKKFTSGNIQPTNIDLDVGKTATVIEEINNEKGTGRARLNGVDWKAVSDDNSVINVGTIVKINSIKGAKLFVSPCDGKINI